MNTAVMEKRGISTGVILLIALMCGSMLLLRNGIYLLCCVATIILIFMLLWRNQRPGILVFAFLMQWTQVITYVIWMNVSDVDINYLSPHAGVAVIMSCIGLLTMAVVVAVGVNRIPRPAVSDLAREAAKINERKIFYLYLGSTLFLSSIGFIFGLASGFTQILVTLSSLKWIFFFMYGYVVWANRKNRGILALMIFYEFASSLYSYFSSFKHVILVVIILSLTFITVINLRQVIYVLLVGLLLGFLGVTWSAVKGDYRKYVNQGSNQQVVAVSREQAFDKISDQVTSLSRRDYDFAMMHTLYRLQYVYHLAKTMDRVPRVLPHEGGNLWIENLRFVLLPRMFSPNKAVLDASAKTNKYTGLNYGGFSKGISFGIGYFADCYIDFGYTGMVFPLILLALFVVFIYRVYYNMGQLNILFRYALINVTLFNFTSFESDAVIVVGRLLITFIVYWAIARFVFPRLQNWLYK